MSQIILFGNVVLTEEEFKPIFIEWYQTKQNELIQNFQELIIKPLENMKWEQRTKSNSSFMKYTPNKANKRKYNAETVFKNWEIIQKNFFGNDSVGLLGVVQFEGNGYQWTKIINESEYMTQKGITLSKNMLKNIFGKLENAYAKGRAQEIFNKHFQDFMNQLQGYTMDSYEAQILHINMYYWRSSKKQRKDSRQEHYTGRNYNDTILAKQNAGKAFDAFLSHMGNMHNDLLSLLYDDNNTGNTNVEDLPDCFPDIFSNPHVVQPWLYESLNSFSWLRGGDYMGGVDSNTRALKYNIQLKTLSNKTSYTFDLAVTELYNLCMYIIENQNNPEKIADVMWDHLSNKISEEIPPMENFFESKAMKMVEKNLGMQFGSTKIINSNINIT